MNHDELCSRKEFLPGMRKMIHRLTKGPGPGGGAVLKTFGGRLRRGLAANQDETAELRTSLCKNKTSWGMKIFNPPSNFACS